MGLAPQSILERFQVLKYRSLIMSIAISDLKIRYRNSFLGFIWSFLEPLLILGVLYIVFTNLLGSGIKNYPLYLLLGLIMWNMFTRSTSISTSSLIARSGVISKIYFPREILPIASCITAFIMMIFELGAFCIFMAAFQFVPPYTIIFLIVPLTLLFVLSLGVSLTLSVTNVYFRDMQYIWGVIIQGGFFLAPIIFPMTIYPQSIRNLIHLNPIAGLVDLAHQSVLYNTMPTIQDLAYPAFISFAALGIGYLVFRKFEAKAMEIL